VQGKLTTKRPSFVGFLGPRAKLPPPPYPWAHILRPDPWGLFRFVAWLGPRGWIVAAPDTPESPKTPSGPR
jgi:hypothetical protein